MKSAVKCEIAWNDCNYLTLLVNLMKAMYQPVTFERTIYITPERAVGSSNWLYAYTFLRIFEGFQLNLLKVRADEFIDTTSQGAFASPDSYLIPNLYLVDN
ncbi:hypothetical protein QAD02_006312 [Eretmocerus hayati]|uniref:Uncharacterized protein n=1 Tax=Eretmocerus hayati TaxID=131215 RepID=A0ACC2N4P6_9HYME|nr:hypothetical protein QAD02_006312 [Eretmocerus hayati]